MSIFRGFNFRPVRLIFFVFWFYKRDRNAPFEYPDRAVWRQTESTVNNVPRLWRFRPNFYCGARERRKRPTGAFPGVPDDPKTEQDHHDACSQTTVDWGRGCQSGRGNQTARDDKGNPKYIWPPSGDDPPRNVFSHGETLFRHVSTFCGQIRACPRRLRGNRRSR